MLDLSMYERYLANDDDVSPELTRELLDAYRLLQGENVRLTAHLAEQEAGGVVNGVEEGATVWRTSGGDVSATTSVRD